MKFETIDSDQIDDIMSGKPPRAPEDWTGDADEDVDSKGGTSHGESTESDPEGGIGGPAGQH